MFFGKNHHEAYWNSYRLLEGQLLRLSHSIRFDDTQTNVYSSELADIINSACIKIESLAKDIYEDHIWPFQMDADVVPLSFTEGKFKKSATKFDPEKWTRDKWKFDYNCLVEIDHKFFLSKKQVKLKIEKFQFLKYGSAILPFGRISADDCMGGYWLHSEREHWRMDQHLLQPVDWCKSYQAIKHNYIQSIPEHGTVKNAIMVMAAFYLLTVYHSCLPSRQFDIEKHYDLYQMDFGSELFACGICNYTIPPCIIDSDYVKWEAEQKSRIVPEDIREVIREQELLHDIEGYPFLVTLDYTTYNEVCKLVEQYCAAMKLDRFDIAPYDNNNLLDHTDSGAALYAALKKYIRGPYRKEYICISFNIGTAQIYDRLLKDDFGYEKSKYKNKTAAVLSKLQVGDFVDVNFVLGEKVFNGEVIKIDEHSIDISADYSGVRYTMSHPKANIVFVRKVN